MSVPSGTRFIGIQPGVDMVEKKSSQANSPTEVYTIEDIQSSSVPYTGATQDVDLGEYELKAGQIELDQTPTGTAGVAVTRWNDTAGVTETTLKGGSVILKNGVDLVARVVNKVTPNATLTKAAYKVVKISGAQGQRLAVGYAQANNDSNSADTLGVVIETIPTNQEGFIMTMGQLEGINTTGSLQSETWVDGDVLYLSPTTPGAVTKVKPTGATGHIVVIGYVEYAHAINGKIYVKIMNGWELDELHNVYIDNGTLANNQVLTYESSTQLWKNKTPESGITVGTTAVTSGTDGRVFFQAGGVIQQDANFTFDNTLKRLTLKAVGTAVTDIPFAIQNSAGTANLMQVAGNNTMTFLSSGGKIIFSQDTVGQGSVISLRRDFTNQEIIRLDGTNGGGITLNQLNDGSVKSFAIGSVADGLSMWTQGIGLHNIQIKNSFHNLFHVVGNPNSATATFRIGTIASDTNFFNVHGRNAGGTGLTTNPVFTVNSSGTVGIGTEASSPGARLDVRAQGALSTDIAFRVRNSADSIDIFTVNGNGVFYKPHASANNDVAQDVFVSQMSDGRNKIRLFTKGSFNVSSGIGISFQSDAAGSNISSYTLSGAFLNSGGSYRDNGGLSEFNVGTTNITGYSYLKLQNNTNTATNIYISRTGTIILNPDNANAQVRGLSIFGGTLGSTADRVISIGNGTSPTTSTVDNFQFWSSDITAGNAAPHFRTENGAIVKVYQETTGVAASTLVGGGGTALTDTDTFDGYTLKQIVKALRNQGLLA
jgi:nitrogen fixation protein